MFERIDESRCVVNGRRADENAAMLVWDTRYGKKEHTRGASLPRFADECRAAHHRDYWDATENCT